MSHDSTSAPAALDPQILPKVYTQSYQKKTQIDGVKIVNIKNISGEDGSFSEVIRIDENGEVISFPGFHLAQVNRTTQIPGSVKAWHLHQLQDEIWYVPSPYTIFVGLWDVRENSPTNGVVNRIVLDGCNPQLLFIPKGVAHGSTVFGSSAVNLYYLINRQFDINNPDERRIPWNALGAEFWQPERD